ncbi:DUF2283 domain-containing protein [archaeon]|nr:DUF2283 domain-containing protein [archaeon]
MDTKHLDGKGKVDYDYNYDILFFKISQREYKKSIELDNIVLDVDKEGFIVGMQIFGASKFLNLTKAVLLKIPNWNFQSNVDGKRIEVRLTFQVMVRNKIIEKNPIIMEPLTETLPNSEITCGVSS